MREILLDDVRQRNALKRGRYWKRVDFQLAEEIGFEHPSDLLDFNAALNRLENSEPEWSKVVELRVFGAWSFREIANILGIGESTARHRCTKAKDWLRAALGGPIQ
jgi:DNA-directed RNA polymerase specialized sigma24 family protein